MAPVYTGYTGYKPPQTYAGNTYAGDTYAGGTYYEDGKPTENYGEYYQDSVYEEKKNIEKKKRRSAICCEVVALVIGFIGLIGVAAVTGLPMWTFTEENIIVMEKRARGLMCSSVALTTIALIVSAVGMKCTKAIDHRARTKHVVLVVGGCLFLMGCVTTVIPVSWTGHVILRDFYNPPLIDAQRRELGVALYIGWVTSALLFTAGVILLCRHAPHTQKAEALKYEAQQPPAYTRLCSLQPE
ncbi:hypothetical protein WMY93_029135 [Mugilogobius chulae]|uniref:Uncharacterized protein n=1 Tax=Mugilogobius chulae TaxID=88201 RepID=A0AAW0MWF7_9GOBI